MQKPNWIRISAAVAAVLVAAGVWMGARSRGAAEGRLSEPLKRGEVVESVYGIGTVMANKSFQMKPGVVTTIGNLFVKEGDEVKRDQPLVELERSVVIPAPFDGTVTALPVKVGENVFAQTVVLELTDLQDRYVTVSLEQRAAIRVRRGQTARLSFENMRETSLAGTVESVYSRAGDFLVRIEVPELPPQILPGMTADVAISIRQRSGALLVPVSAIREGSVAVKRDGILPVRVEVKTGLADGAFAEVTEGDLKPGDRVIVPAATVS